MQMQQEVEEMMAKVCTSKDSIPNLIHFCKSDLVSYNEGENERPRADNDGQQPLQLGYVSSSSKKRQRRWGLREAKATNTVISYRFALASDECGTKENEQGAGR